MKYMITFICGVPCAGKTTYREKNFPAMQFVDVYDFQQKFAIKTPDNILRSYQLTIEKALELSQNGDVIIEQTLLKRKRREDAIKALRDGGYEGEIHLIFIAPPKKTIMKRAKEKLENEWGIEDFVNANLEVAELPTNDEDFASITIIKD